MKLRYLGTAAAEGIPALFCCCDVCRRSKAAGGPNVRTRSQAIVDDTLLIDFPPDTYQHVLYHGLDLMRVQDCLLTHSHGDHLYATDITMRRKGFAHFEGDRPFPLTFHASAKTCDALTWQLGDAMLESCHVRLHVVEAFQPFAVGRYRVTAFTADHDESTGPFFYAVGDGDRTLLYANDTGFFPDATWDYLREARPRFDFVSLDCTGALQAYRRGHMSVPVGLELRDKLLELGCADAATRWCYHHFSHNGLATHDDLIPVAREKGFLVSYDGMECDV